MAGETGAGRLPAWLTFPTFVAAPAPYDRTQTCQFRLPPHDAHKASVNGRQQIIMQLWSIVLGAPPPVMNVESYTPNLPAKEGLTDLKRAHACFQGIERKMADDNEGEKVLVYVLKPAFFYEFQYEMACMARKRPVPDDLIFAVYVRLDRLYANGGSAINGAVSHWHFIEADPAAPMLPRDHGSRYRRRHW